MTSALKRKSSEQEHDRPTKSAKLDIDVSEPTLSGSLQFAPESELMDVDMDIDAFTPGSVENSPSTTPSSVLPSYPNLQIYTPLNPLDSSTPLDTPSTDSPFFDSPSTTSPDQDMYSHSPQLLKPLISPTSTCTCERIPKLQMSCPKPNGNRSLWSFCDGCGAIGIVA
ncbi:hypothetical protein CALVIDRAFT_530082 [Calocera viscosa TUFC12733]|uniref:Uncharacterized protein n=1 Tax=Calocera viscosa (strain TUFC12733) TaxID=1330018 RepID=A0A167IG36_CALVF|nr:hypothetical protein CALVIDRAFT_530082 [Calocera viscosa TUFC12733]